jgi:hypothetical protein
MRPIARLIAVAAAAALLGLAAAVLAGARICKVIATELPAPAPPTVAPQNSSGHENADEPRRPAETEATTTTADRAASPVSPARRRRARPARPAATSVAEGDPFFEELGRGITKLDEHHYAITPSALEHALANLRSLSRAVRISPEVREGKPSGYKLVWVQADGPIARIGLRSDDVLVSVNGLDITTPDHVLDAYGKLKAARVLVLGLVREGRRSTLEYAIH